MRPSTDHNDHPAIRVQDQVYQPLWPESPASGLLLARKPCLASLEGPSPKEDCPGALGTCRSMLQKKLFHWTLKACRSLFLKPLSFPKE